MPDEALTAAVVSCDIVGHSSVDDQAVQVHRVSEINRIVRETLAQEPEGQAVWASGGDGGHVLFLRDDWCGSALALTAALRRWSVESSVPLRVTAHVGEVVVVRGADGRAQPVGDGINEAGAILDVGGAEGIVVSDRFRAGVERQACRQVRFHDSRRLVLRERDAYTLHLLSFPDDESQWARPTSRDEEAMREASARGDAWLALYYAKRILQLNGASSAVDVTLRRLRPTDYWYDRQDGDKAGRIINPFFGFLDPRALRAVIRSSHLVERRYNELLCRYGDEGDTMFVVLRGSVGVLNSEGVQGSNGAGPQFVLGRGEIAGELAFLLNRRRTADLVALADTSLLAFSFDEISARVAASAGRQEILERVERFMTARILEHVGHHCRHLIGQDGSGALTGGPEPADSLLEDIAFASRTVVLQPTDGPLSLASPPLASGVRGVHLLVSGELASLTHPGRRLTGNEFPIVYLDVEPGLTGPDHEYEVVKAGTKLLTIGQEAIDQLPDATRTAVVRSMRGELARLYAYDSFLSFNYGDEAVVERWRQRFAERGLSVYVDVLSPGDRFTTTIQRALLDSLTLVAFVSPSTMVKPAESNWVRKEVAFRESNFEHPWIVPVALRGADLDRFGLRYTLVDAREDDKQAFEQVVALVSAIREGREPPPALRGRTLRDEL